MDRDSSDQIRGFGNGQILVHWNSTEMQPETCHVSEIREIFGEDGVLLVVVLEVVMLVVGARHLNRVIGDAVLRRM